MRRIYFEEEQKFNQPRVWILLVLIFVSISSIVMGSFLLGIGDNTAFSSYEVIIGRIILVIIFSAILWLMFKMKLIVKVTDEGILYSYPPLIHKEKIISKTEIENFSIRKYKPIIEYGGYGIRVSRRNSGKAFNVSGKIGMQLYLKNGKKVLFGTQRAEAFKYAMDKMMGKA